MTQQHPITPPPELVKQLCDKAILHAVDGAKRGEIEVWLIQEAFRAGADQELEACCEWLVSEGWFRYEHEAIEELRAARRPESPSLKTQALAALHAVATGANDMREQRQDFETLRRALEQMP